MIIGQSIEYFSCKSEILHVQILKLYIYIGKDINHFCIGAQPARNYEYNIKPMGICLTNLGAQHKI